VLGHLKFYSVADNTVFIC